MTIESFGRQHLRKLIETQVSVGQEAAAPDYPPKRSVRRRAGVVAGAVSNGTDNTKTRRKSSVNSRKLLTAAWMSAAFLFSTVNSDALSADLESHRSVADIPLACNDKMNSAPCQILQIDNDILRGDIAMAIERLQKFGPEKLRKTYLAYLYSNEFLKSTYDPEKSKELFLSVRNEPCHDRENIDCIFSLILSELGYARQLLCPVGNISTVVEFHKTNPLFYLSLGLVQIKVAENVISESKEGKITLKTQSDRNLEEIDEIIKSAKYLAVMTSYVILKHRYSYKKKQNNIKTENEKSLGNNLNACFARVASRYWDAKEKFKEPFGFPSFIKLESVALLYVHYFLTKSTDDFTGDSGDYFRDLAAKTEKAILQKKPDIDKDRFQERIYCSLSVAFIEVHKVERSNIYKHCMNYYS